MRTSQTVKGLLGGILVSLALVIGASAASAQDNGDYTAQPPAVAATSATPASFTEPASAVAPAAALAAPTRSSARDLPVTGADIVGFVVIGVVLLAGGLALLTVRRRTTST